MNWKLKAAAQRICAALPSHQETVYYALQRAFGNIHGKPHPLSMLSECARLTGRLNEAAVSVEDARVMEVGTGRRLDMPIGFYLAGAASTVTFDLHRYLKPALVMAAVNVIREHRAAVRGYFAPLTDHAGLDRRLDALCSAPAFPDLLKLASIEYRAPGNAAATDLPAGSVDIHTSYTVFEHIPSPILKAILNEATRVLAPNGVALHHIDPSDHFSHDDSTISAINFLQFPEAQWEKYAGNQFAYHNRLRANGFAELYRQCGHEILQWTPSVDGRCRKVLENGFPLDPEFGGISPELLCTTVLHVLSRPKRQ